MSSLEELIYGKNSTQRIVSVEANSGELEIFIENPDGSIETTQIPNKFWMLSNKQINSKWIRLRGGLHYHWGKQFDDRYSFTAARKELRGYDTFSIYDPIEASLVNTGITYFKGMKHDEVSILSFDIETMGLEHNSESKVLLISNTFRKLGKIERKLFSYNEYENQGKLLEAWCDWVREINPSIMCGHNIYAYDLPYMQFIADTEGVELKLGRDGSAIKFNQFESKFRKDATQFYHYKRCRIYGREIIDTLFLAIKYDIGRKYESYGLKKIIAQEGLEVKDRVFYDASRIRFTYENPEEWKKIKAYAMFDADDSLALYDLMSPPIFYMTQSVPKSYSAMGYTATGSQLNAIMIRSYLQNKHSISRADEAFDFEGAISFAVPGVYKNVLKIDFRSLYPNIIRQFGIYNKNKDPEGNFLKMVEIFTLERLKNKKLAEETKDKYYSDLEQSQKIGINSSYGMLGASGLNFNSPRHAAEITRHGRELLKQSIEWATSKNYEYWFSLFKEKTNE